jgi:hypothetical protein
MLSVRRIKSQQSSQVVERDMIETNLRELPENAPIDDRLVTVLLIRGSVVMQAKNKTEKRELASLAKPDDLLLCVWTGQWSSDAFVLPLDKLTAV